jgi:indolepyruvate ferredoxin oxidoreductase, beta subunit
MTANSDEADPISIVIAALGGEGGGVLAKWIIDAAETEGLPVQSTSIPGVAQRTGATTYYIEMERKKSGGKSVLALTPTPGAVDVMIASELLEIARALKGGYVTADRTTLIGSTHRIYSYIEKQSPTDGRFESADILRAAKVAARQLLLANLQEQAKTSRSAGNAVMLGMLAASNTLPITAQSFRLAIETGGVAVASNLRGFDAGFEAAAAILSGQPDDSLSPCIAGDAQESNPDSDALREFPAEILDTMRAAVKHLNGYQDSKYIETYLSRVRRVVAVDSAVEGFVLANEAARYLALWMAYEDVIRVADLKTRPERYLRIQSDVDANRSDLVHVTEFLRPGLREIADILPGGLARLVLKTRRSDVRSPIGKGLKLRTTTITGFLTLCVLAWLRPMRRVSYRFQQEWLRIEDWLDKVVELASRDALLAKEWVECAHLLRGYGDTYHRGLAGFLLLRKSLDLIEAAPEPAEYLKRLRTVALNDPTGKQLASLF